MVHNVALAPVYLPAVFKVAAMGDVGRGGGEVSNVEFALRLCSCCFQRDEGCGGGGEICNGRLSSYVPAVGGGGVGSWGGGGG